MDPDSVRARPLIIGHRGSGVPSTDSGADLENSLIGNTLSGIKVAIDAKVDWIEIDIRKSGAKDGENAELFVFHDPNVAAKTDFDRDGSTGEVSDLAPSELKALNLHVASDNKILTLNEVFASSEIALKEIKWIFDIKANGIKPDVLDWITKKDLPKDQLIIFGDHEVLKDYQDLGYPLGYTTLFSKSWYYMLFNPSEMFDRCDSLGCTLIVVPIFFVTKAFVDDATDRGIDVWCYDSNNEADLKYAVGCGVKGVIVDHPARAITTFE